MKRLIVRDEGGHQREAKVAEHFSNPGTPNILATDANATLTAVILLAGGGVVQYSSFSAGRTITTDTAVALLAAFLANADIGDSVKVQVSTKAAFAITWSAGVGVTLKGRATTPASSYSDIVITKTAAATCDFYVP